MVDTRHRLRDRLLARLIRGGVFLLLLGVAALTLVRAVYADAIYPGVTVGGINIGGLERQAARDALAQQAALYEENLISFLYAGKRWTPTLTELGVTTDLDGTLERAYRVGRSSDARDRIVDAFHLLKHDEMILFDLSLDGATLATWYDRVDEDLGQPARDATLAIDGTTVAVVPEREGLVVDRVAATERIVAGLKGLRPITIELPVSVQMPHVRADDLTEDRQALEKAFASPIEVLFENKTWTVTPGDLAQFVHQQDGAAEFTLDESALTQWLAERFRSEIERAPVDAVVAWSAERSGPIAIEPSVDGVKLKPKTFAKTVAASFWGDHAPVSIPVTIVKPRIDGNDLGNLGITTRLAVGDSSYEGSNDGRATNIQVGARLLNGTLVPPGESFSFNHSVGVINEDAGFVEAQVIQGERIGRDIGGGICQVSTTVYRAALKAGLPISEWWPHTYRLGFYEQDGWLPGYDASILQPNDDPFSGGDFQFTNPTDSWLLVESYTDGARVIVIIYGPDLGYEVDLGEMEISDPIPVTEDLEIVDETLPDGTIEQTEVAQEGLITSFTRTVTDRAGNQILQDTWTTQFAPRGNVWKVSPDMKGQSPAANRSQ